MRAHRRKWVAAALGRLQKPEAAKETGVLGLRGYGGADGNGAGRACDEFDASGNLIDMDAHRDALGQTHPGEHRIDARQAPAVRCAVLVADGVADAFDMADDRCVETHKRGARSIADMDPGELCLFEIAGDPE